MPAVRYNLVTRAMWRIHKALFRLSGGRIGSRIAGHGVLFVTTTGRLSGESRTVGLYYLEVPVSSPGGGGVTAEGGDGGGLRRPDRNQAYAVVGSFAGEDRDPAWAHNLRADPMATVKVGKEEHRVRARQATGEERDRLLRRFVEKDGAYRVYLERTDRVIPIFVLERLDVGP